MKTKLRDYIKQIYRGIDTHSYPRLHDRKKNVLITFFLYCFLAISATFIISEFLKQDYSFLPADASFFLLSLGLLYFLKVKNKLKEVILVFIILICIISTLFTLTGGMKNTGILTTVLVPIPIILLLGKKRGFWILISFFLINAIGLIILKQFELEPKYATEWLNRVVVAFIIISMMAFVNEYIFDQLYLRIETISDSIRVSQERYKNLAINREKFLSLVSNDLLEPISNFTSISNTLNNEYDHITEIEKKKLINQMATLSEQNSKLLHDLLKWSTVINETIPYSPKPIKLEKIYREVIELFNPAIEEKKLSVFFKMKSNSEVYADHDMLGSIMRNLVSNAIKFSEPGGEIRITAKDKKNLMFVSVIDTGIGMSEEDLLRLNSFVSFSNSGTLDESGIGIGLILIKEFVQKSRGDFFINSKLGKGTEASFSIPLAE